jgi:hypothetical protein
MTGSRAVTSPPGLGRHTVSPSGPSTRSTGSRLATTTKSRSAAEPSPAAPFDFLIEDIGYTLTNTGPAILAAIDEFDTTT